MARKKVSLSFIPNEAVRRASYKKRKKGLIKKVSELSTLCGVDACAIIYSPFEAEPTVWPSVEGAQAVLARLQRMPTVDQTRKMVNQETYTRQRIKKTDDQLRRLRLRRDSRLRQMEKIMFSHLNGNPQHFNPADAADMVFVINQALREIKAELRRREKMLPPPPPPAAVASVPEVSMGMSLGLAGVGEEAIGMGFNFIGGHEEALPQRSAEDLEGFPWHLVESPAFQGLDDGLGWDDGGGRGWDDNEAWQWQCPSYFFDDGAGPSGAK